MTMSWVPDPIGRRGLSPKFTSLAQPAESHNSELLPAATRRVAAWKTPAKQYVIATRALRVSESFASVYACGNAYPNIVPLLCPGIESSRKSVPIKDSR